MAEILLYIECDENKILDASYDLITGVKKNNKGANVSGVIVLHPDFIILFLKVFFSITLTLFLADLIFGIYKHLLLVIYSF